MSLFNRITATFVSTVDKAVSQVENHDAVVDASIRDTRKSAARARVRLARVRKDGESLRAKLSELKKAEQTWTARTRQTASEDESMALECLRRRRACQEQIGNLNASLVRHEELERQVSASLEKIEARLHEITQQRNMMRSRQSAAEALRVINNIEGAASGDIEETFDRWEMLVTEAEFTAGQNTSVDTLESHFTAAEDSAELRAELRILLATDEDSNND